MVIRGLDTGVVELIAAIIVVEYSCRNKGDGGSSCCSREIVLVLVAVAVIVL